MPSLKLAKRTIFVDKAIAAAKKRLASNSDPPYILLKSIWRNLDGTQKPNVTRRKQAPMTFRFFKCPASAGLAMAAGLAASISLNAKAELIYGVSDQLDQLVSFDSSDPEALKSAISLTGIASGEQIRGIDWVSGVLYGLGDQNHLYTINPGTGLCTQVGSGSFSPVLNGIDFGFTGTSVFNVSSDLGQNITINPTTGAATVGPNYTGASLGALAYNSLTGTFLGVGIDTQDLYSVNPATGSTTLIGPSGVNFLGGIALDISPSTDLTYFSGTVNGQTELFTVNASTGAFSLVGDIGAPGSITSGLEGLADTGIPTVPEPTTAAFLTIGGGLAVMLLRRKR
ncbi:MAG: DUF4394 domain-containing protein [Verrucomicrobiota bacterium]